MLADFLGFGGALGIQVVVAALQREQTEQLDEENSYNNTTIPDGHLQNIKVPFFMKYPVPVFVFLARFLTAWR